MKHEANRDDELGELARRQDAERRRLWARSPKPAASVIAQVMHQNGYGRSLAPGRLDDAWREAVGETIAAQTATGKTRRGVLEIVAANSTLIQELSFRKKELLGKLKALAPDEAIRDIRFKSGVVARPTGQ
jgi:predicted nucleic acid-binding Zn ribbon protein